MFPAPHAGNGSNVSKWWPSLLVLYFELGEYTWSQIMDLDG
jgi:hypothetical protein